MKIESVSMINLKGEYEVLYMGSSRGEAREVYKAHMTKKDTFKALFQQSGHASRTMSKAGFVSHKEKEATKEITEKPKRTRSKKISEE